jgi:exopolyphosphatase/guanosine-5'-triphosphate,3'-diphosphate pyrophosphatase
MREQLDPYDSHKVHLATLSCEDVDALERMLASLTVEERRHVIGLQPKRAPVILGGAIAIRELLRVTGFGELTVSESDLLFGLALAVSAAESGRSIVGGWKPGLSRL